ncbi:MAG: hypothetical protein WC326_07505 [Candidatus Delongbacteria bacterium]
MKHGVVGLLLLILRVQAALHFSEDWQGAVVWPGGRAAWGAHHVWLATGTTDAAHEEGFPAGVVAVIPTPAGPWAVLADGRLAGLAAASPQIWQADRLCLAAEAAGPAACWLLGAASLRRVALHGLSSPEILELIPLPGEPGARELRVAEGRPWLRLGGRIWRLGGGGLRPVAELPADWRDWCPRQDRLLGLDPGGRLRWLDDDGGHPPVFDGASGGRPEWPCWRRLRATPAGLWLQDVAGGWWLWERDVEPRAVLPAPEAGAQWLPVQPDLSLRQDARQRGWWRPGPAGWRGELELERPPALLDRLPRWTSDWRLAADGGLERRVGGRWDRVRQARGPRGLLPAGAGPLLLDAEGLWAYADEGGSLGGWPAPGLRCAAPLEDHVLVADSAGLHTLSTEDSPPRELHALPLAGCQSLSAAPLWAAAWAGGRIWLLERWNPAAPRLVDGRAAPPELTGLLLLEDRLFLLQPDHVRVWSCGAGHWEETEPALELPGARWACARGADRLLTLDEAGCLRQYRLWDNLPVREEWRRDLPLTGALRLARDSLRVTGAAGWLDLALPALADPLPPDRPARLAARAAGPALRQEARALVLNWPDAGRAPAVLVLHDLLGRQLARVPVQAGRARLELGARAAGCYFLSELEADGRLRSSQTLRWPLEWGN